MAELLTHLIRLKDTPRYYAGGLYRQLDQKDIFLWAQAIAFKVLVTIVPVIILGTGILGQVLEQERSFETVARFVRNFLPAEQSGDLTAFLKQLSGAGDTLTIIGVLGLLFSAFTLFTTLRVAISNVFQEEWHETRSILRGYLFDLRMTGQVGLFFLLTIGLSILVRRSDLVDSKMLEVLLPFLVTTIMFFQLFYFVPKPPPPKRSVLFGALFTAVLWEAAKSGFTVYATYVGRFDRYAGEGASSVLGSTFGLIIAFVFWIYYSGVVLCLGAVMVLLHEKRHRSRRLAALAKAAEAAEAEAAEAAQAAEAKAAEAAEAAETAKAEAAEAAQAAAVAEAKAAEAAEAAEAAQAITAEAAEAAQAAAEAAEAQTAETRPVPDGAPAAPAPPAPAPVPAPERHAPEPAPPETTRENMSVN